MTPMEEKLRAAGLRAGDASAGRTRGWPSDVLHEVPAQMNGSIDKQGVLARRNGSRRARAVALYRQQARKRAERLAPAAPRPVLSLRQRPPE